MASKALQASILARLTIAPAILVVVFVIKALFPILQDPDFYWHLKVGEYIVSNGALPAGELFTYTHPGENWVHSEWLFQIILFAVYSAFGFAGVNILVAILYTACWYVTFLSCNRVLKDEAKAVITTMLFCGMVGAVAPRPQLLTFLFFSLTIYLIVDFKYGKGLRKLWLFPPMMALWANAHGGYFLGLVLFALFVLSEWTMFLFRGGNDAADGRRLKTLAWVAVVALFATLINPGFVHGWWYPFEVIMNSADTAIISEWQSPNFHLRLAQYFLIAVFLFFVAAAYSRKRPDLTEFAIPLLFMGGAFYSMRNIPYAAFAMAPFFAVFVNSILSAAQERVALGESNTVPESPLSRVARSFHSAGNIQVGQKESLLNWILVGTTLAAVALIYPVHIKTLEAEMKMFLPVRAADFVVQEGIKGRMFNTYHHGGYLIYRLFPDQKVFIYPRTDFYRPHFLKEYVAVYTGDPIWKALFSKLDIDYVICESAAPLRQLLLEGDEYRLVFDDGMHSVLVKDTDKYRKIIEQYGDNPAHG